MNEQDISKIWHIDTKLQMGEDISEEEGVFYNKNRKLMIINLQEELDHWKFHTEDY